MLHKILQQTKRKLHNEQLHDFYLSPNIFRAIKRRKMRWAGYTTHTEMTTAENILVGKFEERKRLFGRLEQRCQHYSKLDFREFWYEGVDWIQMARDRMQCLVLVTMVTNLQVS
jgi:hypothetical protein